MNWLAHVLLSTPEADHRIGNLVADFVKERAWNGASDSVLKGLNLHQCIDSFTDSNAIVKQSISRLGEQGKLRNVAIDVLYDHFLTKNWSNYCSCSLEDFLEEVYLQIKQEISNFPTDVQVFLNSVVELNRLGLYGDMQGVSLAFERIDKRLSQRVRSRESLSQYYDEIVRNYSDLESDFFEFFPELQDEAEAHIKKSEQF